MKTLSSLPQIQNEAYIYRALQFAIYKSKDRTYFHKEYLFYINHNLLTIETSQLGLKLQFKGKRGFRISFTHHFLSDEYRAHTDGIVHRHFLVPGVQRF